MRKGNEATEIQNVSTTELKLRSESTNGEHTRYSSKRLPSHKVEKTDILLPMVISIKNPKTFVLYSNMDISRNFSQIMNDP